MIAAMRRFPMAITWIICMRGACTIATAITVMITAPSQSSPPKSSTSSAASLSQDAADRYWGVIPMKGKTAL